MAQGQLEMELTQEVWPISVLISLPLQQGRGRSVNTTTVSKVAGYLAELQYLTLLSLEDVRTRPRPLLMSCIFS